MSIYVRPTRKLCLLTVLVSIGAIALTFYISFALAQELGARAGRHTYVVLEGDLK